MLLKRRYNKANLSSHHLIQLYHNQKGLCALSQVPMTFLHGEGNVSTNISIDRIVPDLGYEEGNIQLVCRVVNHMKWSLTLDELKQWCKLIIHD